MHSTPPSPFLQRSTHTMCQSGVVDDDESCSIGLTLVALEIVVPVVSICSVVVMVAVVGISVSSVVATAIVVVVVVAAAVAGAAAAVVVSVLKVVVEVLVTDSVSLECASEMDFAVESDVDGKFYTVYKKKSRKQLIKMIKLSPENFLLLS